MNLVKSTIFALFSEVLNCVTGKFVAPYLLFIGLILLLANAKTFLINENN